jgi:hypothetical protein
MIPCGLVRCAPEHFTSIFRVEDEDYYVGFEVLTAVIMKSTIFWDITLCSPLSVNRRFGGNILRSSACHLLSCWFLARLIFSSLKMKAICSPETSVDNGLHGFISQKTVLFMKVTVFEDVLLYSLVDSYRSSSGILVMIFQGTQCDIPEDSNLHNHCYENLRSDGIQDFLS